MGKKEAAVLKVLQTVYFLVKSDISNNKYQNNTAAAGV